MYQFRLQHLFIATVGAAIFFLACRWGGFWRVLAPLYTLAAMVSFGICLRSFATVPSATLSKLLGVVLLQGFLFCGFGTIQQDRPLVYYPFVYYPVFQMYYAVLGEQFQRYGGSFPQALFDVSLLGVVTYTPLLLTVWCLAASGRKQTTAVRNT